MHRNGQLDGLAGRLLSDTWKQAQHQDWAWNFFPEELYNIRRWTKARRCDREAAHRGDNIPSHNVFTHGLWLPLMGSLRQVTRLSDRATALPAAHSPFMYSPFPCYQKWNQNKLIFNFKITILSESKPRVIQSDSKHPSCKSNLAIQMFTVLGTVSLPSIRYLPRASTTGRRKASATPPSVWSSNLLPM